MRESSRGAHASDCRPPHGRLFKRPKSKRKSGLRTDLEVGAPPDLGETSGPHGVGEVGVAPPDQLITNWTQSGNSTFVRAGDEVKYSPSDAELVDAVDSAKAECRKLGA